MPYLTAYLTVTSARIVGGAPLGASQHEANECRPLIQRLDGGLG